MRGVADASAIRRFMRALGDEAGVAARVYFTGGATAVLMGWRATTIDVDVHWEPDCDEPYRALPGIKERLGLNVEIAWPFDFIPQLPGWRDRCLFVGAEGRLQFLHCDLYAQALAKIERSHVQDRLDVQTMLDRGLVERPRLLELFEAIVPHLHRYPAIDPASFRLAVEGYAAR